MGAIKKSTDEVMAVLTKTKGNVKFAAKELRTSRESLYKYIRRHPTVKRHIDDIREGTKDDAETMLQTRMMSSDTLLIFYLKTQAKDRGYVERQEHSGPDGDNLTITLNWGDNAEPDNNTSEPA